MRSLLPLLPVFLIFCIAILSRSATYSDSTLADETKFYEHAENITHGFYADAENPNLMEGPGYPLYLAIPAALHLPHIWVRASHILLLTLAAFYLFLILRRYISRRPALVFTYLFALYPPLLRWANLMYAESLTILLLLGFFYHFIVWYHREGRYKRHLIYAILLLGYLCLTKIIFAYVILVALAGNLFLLVFPKVARAYQLKKTALIFAGALAVFSPYVVHNYFLTGRFFYLGTQGGLILYHRSTPFKHEYGNFFAENHVLKNVIPASLEDVSIDNEELLKNHGEFFRHIDTLSWMARDSALQAKAIENIRNHPGKFASNTVANLSRIFFHFPFSYRLESLSTLGYLIPNMFIIVLATLGIYPALVRRRQIPKELIILLLLMLIYLAGHTLLGGRGRFFIPMVPILMMFFSFVYFRILQIGFRKD